MKVLYALIISACIVSLIFLYGCGSNVTGGGSSVGDGDAPNTGTILGCVYERDNEFSGYRGISGVIITVSNGETSESVGTSSLGGQTISGNSSIIVGVVVTNLSGQYTITGIPPGKVAVTATKEGEIPLTIIANSAYVNFVIRDLFKQFDGNCTIRGSLEGVPDSINGYQISTKALSRKNFKSSAFSYDHTCRTYEVTGAPNDGPVYVGARYTSTTDTRYFTYDIIDANGGGQKSLSLSFEAEADAVTMEVNVTPPTGYKVARVDAELGNGHTRLIQFTNSSEKIGENKYIIKGLPPLISGAGDSYIISVGVSSETSSGYAVKFFYEKLAGKHDLDLTSLNFPADECIIYPLNNGDVTGTPTFEWKSVGDVDYYAVEVWETGKSTSEWIGITTDTKMSMPAHVKKFMSPGKSYNLRVAGGKIIDYPPIYKLNDVKPTYYEDFIWNPYVWSTTKYITFNYI